MKNCGTIARGPVVPVLSMCLFVSLSAGAQTPTGAFTQALCDEAKKNGWTVISMKQDWKKIFAFD